MVRIFCVGLICVAMVSVALGDEPKDLDAMRQELARLKAAAAELDAKIAAIEKQLAPKLKVGDLVVVDMGRLRFPTGNFPARFQAQVERVLPTGEVALISTRRVQDNGIEYVTTLRGVARPQSFDAARRIRADKIADLVINQREVPVVK